MSRTFASRTFASRTFTQVRESVTAGDYLSQKKAKTTYCSYNVFKPSDHILLCCPKTASVDNANRIDPTQLYRNLYTTLDLTQVSPILQPPMLQPVLSTPMPYAVDPEGLLFGLTPCGLPHYSHYLVPDSPEPFYLVGPDGLVS